MKRFTWLYCGLLSVGLTCSSLGATGDTNKIPEELQTLLDSIQYQQGHIDLAGGVASISLTDSFRFVNPKGTETVLSGLWGNPPDNDKSVLGMLVPTGFSPISKDAWCVIISYEEDGHVKDDDAEKINYDKLLQDMKKAGQDENAERLKQGYDPIELVGWATPPRYDAQSHKFYWAKEIKFGDGSHGNTLNYNLRILGRKGVLVLNAVADMTQFPMIEKATPDILSVVNFNDGNRYADFKPGTDKMAAYGLAALVAGGVAAKAGLFKGLLVALLALKKVIIVGGIAIVAWVRKLMGKKDSTPKE